MCKDMETADYLLFLLQIFATMGELESGIQFLNGVGPRRAALLQKELGLVTLNDLIHLYPFRYIDRSSVQDIAEITPDLAYVQIRGRVVSRRLVNDKRLSVIVEDATGRMEMVFFKGLKWTYDRLEPGMTFLFFGKPQTFNGKLNIVHPEIDVPQEGSMAQGTLTGVYPSTEKLKNGGITGKVMCRLQSAAHRTLPVRDTGDASGLYTEGKSPCEPAVRPEEHTFPFGRLYP